MLILLQDSDNESVRSGRSNTSKRSNKSISERGRSTENTRRSLQKFSGQKYLVKVNGKQSSSINC